MSSIDNTIMMQSKVSGGGSPLLLIPGGLTGWQSWEPFVEIFCSKKREVIMVQLLNVQYGIEDRPLPVNYSVKTESKALTTSLDTLDYLKPLDIVAWSYGALSALDFALDNPERVRTLALIEPPAVWVLRELGPLDYQTEQTMKFFETLDGDITDNMLEEFLKGVGFVKDGQSIRELPQWKAWLPFKLSLRNSPAVVNHNDSLTRLQTLKIPVLLVKGTGSAPFLHSIIDVLASNLNNARVIEMPSGHAPHIVSRDRFLTELGNFQEQTTIQSF